MQIAFVPRQSSLWPGGTRQRGPMGDLAGQASLPVDEDRIGAVPQFADKHDGLLRPRHVRSRDPDRCVY